MKKLFYLIILSLIIAFIGIYFIAPRVILGTNLPFYHIVKGKAKPKKINELKNYPLQFMQLNIVRENSYNIAANLVYCKRAKPKGTILMLHGIRSSKEHFLVKAKQVSAMGYNAVLVDLKAHGQSGGEYCTFGYYEKQDIADLLTFLIENENLPPNYGIWGQSLGGAVALQTLAIDERLSFGIIESTYAELRPTIHRYAKNYTGFNIPMLTNFIIKRMESIAEFTVDDVVPYKSASQIKQPILLAHGAKDKKMPLASANKIFDALKNTKNQKYIIEDANHLNVWQKGGEVYNIKVSSFLRAIERVN